MPTPLRATLHDCWDVDLSHDMAKSTSAGDPLGQLETCLLGSSTVEVLARYMSRPTNTSTLLLIECSVF